jgi:hypothetical protein
MKLNDERKKAMLRAIAVMGVGVFVVLGSYFVGQLVPPAPGTQVFFLGMVFGAGVIVLGCRDLINSRS